MIFDAWLSGLFFALMVWDAVDRRVWYAVLNALLFAGFLWLAVRPA